MYIILYCVYVYISNILFKQETYIYILYIYIHIDLNIYRYGLCLSLLPAQANETFSRSNGWDFSCWEYLYIKELGVVVSISRLLLCREWLVGHWCESLWIHIFVEFSPHRLDISKCMCFRKTCCKRIDIACTETNKTTSHIKYLNLQVNSSGPIAFHSSFQGFDL